MNYEISSSEIVQLFFIKLGILKISYKNVKIDFQPTAQQGIPYFAAANLQTHFRVCNCTL